MAIIFFIAKVIHAKSEDWSTENTLYVFKTNTHIVMFPTAEISNMHLHYSHSPSGFCKNVGDIWQHRDVKRKCLLRILG